MEPCQSSGPDAESQVIFAYPSHGSPMHSHIILTSWKGAFYNLCTSDAWTALIENSCRLTCSWGVAEELHLSKECLLPRVPSRSQDGLEECQPLQGLNFAESWLCRIVNRISSWPCCNTNDFATQDAVSMRTWATARASGMAEVKKMLMSTNERQGPG